MCNATALRRNCELFLEELDRAAARGDRKREEIRVVAVAKTKPLSEVMEIVDFGFRDIGENRLQEAEAKYSGRSRSFGLHMIGHLQSNKVKKAVALFDMIQSVDSLKLAERISSESEAQGRRSAILLEINTSRETQKFGFTSEQAIDTASQVFSLRNIMLQGLMTVGPLTDDENRIREAFQELRLTFEKIKAASRERTEFAILSMGMSDDFRLAIEEGSNMIRIGRALFGPRVS